MHVTLWMLLQMSKGCFVAVLALGMFDGTSSVMSSFSNVRYILHGGVLALAKADSWLGEPGYEIMVQAYSTSTHINYWPGRP